MGEGAKTYLGPPTQIFWGGMVLTAKLLGMYAHPSEFTLLAILLLSDGSSHSLNTGQQSFISPDSAHI